MIQIPVILLTLGFAATIVNPEASLHPQPAAEQPEKPEVAVNALAAPARITATLPENILDAKQAATIALDYTPGDEQTWYFDHDGNPTETASPGGYYRKALGKTADGRRVVQDYYQDSNTPQTAPFTLKKDADPRDYTTGAVDGKITWYRPDGSILAIQQYRNGAPISRLNHYRDGRLAVQSEQPAGVAETDDPYSTAGEASQGRRYYYASGQLLALEYSRNGLSCGNHDCEWAILYDNNGRPLAAYHGERSNDIVMPKYWNTLNHTPADEQTARRQTFDAALERLHELRQMRQQDGL